jgi:hypothetical protein
MATLKGATNMPLEGHMIKDAGEFAALWNSLSEEDREKVFQGIQNARDDSMTCFIQNHKSLLYQVRAREQLIIELYTDLSGQRSWVIEP